MTSETYRCQPCQFRVSLWSSPSSFLAVSNTSLINQALLFDTDQRVHRRAMSALGRGECQFPVRKTPTHQRPSCPEAQAVRRPDHLGIEIGQFQTARSEGENHLQTSPALS